MYNYSKSEYKMSAYGIHIHKNICKRFLICFVIILYIFMLGRVVFQITLTNLNKNYNMKYGKLLTAKVF